MILAQHTLETTARPENIWTRWADPSTYKDWDDGVEWAKLGGGFNVGTIGELKPMGGPAAEFLITALEDGRSFSDLTRLPFARLRFHHSLEPTDMGTRFTHRIEVEGPLAWVWASLLGSKLKAGLPIAMRKLARLAEHQ